MRHNIQGIADLSDAIRSGEYDPGMDRPFLNAKNQPCVNLLTGRTKKVLLPNGQPVTNHLGQAVEVPERETVLIRDLMFNGKMNPVFNSTYLRYREWAEIDARTLRSARARLKAWTDLAAANPVSGFDAYSTMILEYETEDDGGEAVVDMDMLAEERNFEVKYQREGTPLPITHAGWWLSRRRLAASRKKETPLDLAKADRGGRRIGEKIEKTVIGTITGLTYGDSSEYSRAPTVYGYTNFPPRLTKTDMTIPNGSNGPAVLTSWLQLRDKLYAKNMYGPYMVYTSTDYDVYLDNVFSTTQPSVGTLRAQLMQVDGIQGIRRLDYLTNTFTVLIVQMDPNVAEAIVGTPITTTQWDEKGGHLLKFRSWCIHVPRLKCDQLGQCGIAHGTTA